MKGFFGRSADLLFDGFRATVAIVVFSRIIPIGEFSQISDRGFVLASVFAVIQLAFGYLFEHFQRKEINNGRSD